MAVMIMNDYYVIQYLRKVSLGGEGGAASCSGICARVGGAAACSASVVCARVGGAAACSVRERTSACSVRERAAACSRAASARACSSSGVPWGEGGSSKR